MNFTTDLPKKFPHVTYIVASAVKCEKFFPNSKNEGPSFRMHAVILNKNGLQTQKYNPNFQTPKASRTIKSTKNEGDGSVVTKEDQLITVFSAQCSSSIKSEDSERIDQQTKNEQQNSTNRRHTSPLASQTSEKNFILCHIRKIDQNYKMSKYNSAGSEGKKRATVDLEIEVDGVKKKTRVRKNPPKQLQPNLALEAHVPPQQQPKSKLQNIQEDFLHKNSLSGTFSVDPISRISFESENSTSSTFPINYSGVLTQFPNTQAPKFMFSNLRQKGSLNFGSKKDLLSQPCRPEETVCKIDETRDPKSEQIEQNSAKGINDRKIQPDRIEKAITQETDRFRADHGGYDYMKLFNYFSKDKL